MEEWVFHIEMQERGLVSLDDEGLSSTKLVQNLEADAFVRGGSP